MHFSFVPWTLLLGATLLSASMGAASATEWAHLRGRIVYDGTPPEPQRITVSKDQEVCGKFDLFDESLVVNPETRGVRDVIVMLSLATGETTEIHDSYQEAAAGEVVLKNLHCRFEPHVTCLRTTQQLVIRNLDPIGNNVKMDMRKNLSINITVPFGTTHEQRFPLVEAMPARISCSIHPWELAWLVVKDHPYMAVTDADGRFEIKYVPAGKRKFMFWQEAAGYLQKVTVHGEPQAWRRGTPELDLKPGDNDLGEIIVQGDLFRH
ncbi:MAG: cupredoxin domain-containing protein [Pirellulaceae bacterium]